MLEGELEGSARGRGLRCVALLGGAAWAVGVDLGRGGEARSGEIGAQAERTHRVLDDALAQNGLTDQPPASIGLGDVGDLGDGVDDGGLKAELSVFSVTDQIEPVGYLAGFEGLAVARRECGPKLRLV